MYAHTVSVAILRMQALEDPFYYLANFEHVLDWIGSRYLDLLSPREREFIREYPSLPRASRALLVRMVMRKGIVFRASKLAYSEIGAAEDAVKPLVEKGWVDAEPEISLEQLFALLTKPELNTALGPTIAKLGVSKSARKAELLQALKPSLPEPRRYDRWCNEPDDAVYAVSVMDLCDRFRLMFFGNLRQNWSEFVLAELGLYHYETVSFSLASRAFQSRAEVDEYLHLFHCREQFESWVQQTSAPVPLAEMLDQIPRASSDNPWLEVRRSKLLFQVAYYCERRDELATALDLYRGCRYAGARARRIRVLERSGEFQSAFELAQEASGTPESEAEQQQLLRILPRLRRKLGLSRESKPPTATVDRLDLLLPRPPVPYSVEQAVAGHLSQPDSPVWYVENTLVNSLFGLLCWEAIFAPMPGAFFHRYQSGPADLLRPDFTRRRAALFDACLARLDSGEYKDAIRSVYGAKRGLQSPFVYWEGLSESLLEHALSCLPAAHLKAWFRRLLADIKANRAGLPDLIQFWPDEQRYQMIEVKGPGDRLQDNQLRWLDFCKLHGMPVQVCYVQWTDPLDSPPSEPLS